MAEIRAHQFTAIIFFALGAFVLYEGWRLGIPGMYGPGPGMFAAVVGGAMIVAAGIRFTQVTFGETGRSLPRIELDRAGAVRVTVVLASLVAFPLMLVSAGFNLTMLILLLVLLIGFKREHIPLKIVVAVLGSFGTHYVFETLLRVPLPYAANPFLRSLGL